MKSASVIATEMETRVNARPQRRKPLADRLQIIRQLRHLIAANAEALADIAGAVSDRPRAEKLASEVLPLADACRWLERNAARVLAPRRFGRHGRPLWMLGHSFEVQRQPLGTVLVIGPGNYPLFLPAVHSLQAFVAGNFVLLKPAPGTRNVASAFARLAFEAGLDPEALTILPEAVEAARAAIDAGVDKVVFTGSSENGRSLLARLANTNTPAVMELSGEDAVIVLHDADLDLVVRALRFGAKLNGGATCIAPRRLIVVDSIAAELKELLPATEFTTVLDESSAIQCANAGEFCLGASMFSRDIEKARALAAELKTGFVSINDLIVPTADPRMPFGGVKASGFGSTRGAEGLLEMTFPHVVAVRHGRVHSHFDEPSPDDAHLFSTYIRAAHGRDRFAVMRQLAGALITRAKRTQT